MYAIYFYIDGIAHRWNFIFETQYGAGYIARRIVENYGVSADVIDNTTGEVLEMYTA